MNEPMEVAFAPDRLAVLLKHFAELNDERESWRVAYPLKEVLLLVTCATIATCDDFDEIVLWPSDNAPCQEWPGGEVHDLHLHTPVWRLCRAALAPATKSEASPLLGADRAA